MSQLVLDAIDAEIATLTRIVAAPTGELGYGTDVSCVQDFAPDLALVDPFSSRAIGEAVIRRLTCPRGRMPDDPSYGIDLRSFCNRGVPASELRALEGTIRNEVAKDDRIDEFTVDLTMTSAAKTIRVALTITPIDTKLGPFPLVFAITGDGSLAVEAMG